MIRELGLKAFHDDYYNLPLMVFAEKFSKIFIDEIIFNNNIKYKNLNDKFFRVVNNPRKYKKLYYRFKDKIILNYDLKVGAFFSRLYYIYFF
jgi:hypothetical protein